MQSEAKVRLKEELATPLRVLQETARRIAKVSTESGIALIEDEYVQSFKVEMMDAVLQWCKGAKFSEICKVGTAPRPSRPRTIWPELILSVDRCLRGLHH